MCEYPPSTEAGAPIIAKQLFSQYDPDALHVLCSHDQHDASDVVMQSHLDCEHTVVPTYIRATPFRPRRVFVAMEMSINCLRVPRILNEARRIVKNEGTEAIFTIPWRTEFALAAYLLHRETGLPLYVFETDDWHAMNRYLLQGLLIRTYRQSMLEEAEQLWVTSPNMQQRYAERFGVDSTFLFHFVDLDAYLAATAAVGDRSDESVFRVAYTGSINQMFYDSMRLFCDMLNRGLTINGRRVEMNVYGGNCPDEMRGPNVKYRGLVDLSEIPTILADADCSFLGVSFSQDPDIRELVQTSLYTKTIDYLASGRPVLVVSPTYTGEAKYFGDVVHLVTERSEQAIRDALTTIATGGPRVQAKVQAGLNLVRSRHSMDSIHRLFLNHFIKDSHEPIR